jgi:hypothetical protein
MAVADQPAIAAQVSVQPQAAENLFTPQWSSAKRLAFRWCFLYFGLYIILTQMLTSLLFVTTNDSGAFELDITPPARALVVWLASHLFRVGHPIITTETGSGDRIYDWIVLFCIFSLALVGTIVWSLLDRNRRNYSKLYAWFRVFIRFSLAATILTYGAAKILPLQMPFPFLTRLLEPYGNFSPMGVLWSSIGASPGYEIFAGAAEMLAGVLLIFPRTTTLGALVCLADGIQVFMLNMTYDVPVKLLSLHIILIALLVLAADCQRLTNFFFLRRSTEPAQEPPLFRRPRANRIALVVQVLFGLWLIGANVYGSISVYNVYGPGRPKSPLYGIWDVQDFSVDGQTRAPLLTDAQRWRRLVFDFPQYMSAQGMDDSFHGYGVAIDAKAETLALSSFTDKNWKANFSFTQPASGELVLDGTMDGHKIHAQLQLFDRNKFLLVSRGFHWISERPFNR